MKIIEKSNFSEKTAARVLNAMFRGNKNDTRPLAHHAWIDEKGRQCACDGYRAYRLKKPVAGVPDMDPIHGVNLQKAYPDSNSLADYLYIDLPTLEECRAMIAEDNERQKEEKPKFREYIYTFGKDAQGRQLPAVNLKYLADVITLFPDARAYCKRDVPTAPIYFECSDGDAILLPIRLAGDAAEQAAERRQPAPKKEAAPVLPVYGLRTFLALAAAANA